jgi:hypothetical protein
MNSIQEALTDALEHPGTEKPLQKSKHRSHKISSELVAGTSRHQNRTPCCGSREAAWEPPPHSECSKTKRSAFDVV